MKTIGIITIHKPQNNYGGALQCFALYEYLRSKGFKVEVIDLLRPNHADYVNSVHYLPQRHQISKKSYLIGLIREFIGLRTKYGWDSKKGLNKTAIKRFDEFNKRIQYSKTYNYIPDLYKNPPEYDIYIAGSDQLWNPSQYYSLEPFFLTFVKNKKALRISYGTSIGITKLFKNEEKIFKKWLSTFDYISVREMQATELLSKLGLKNVERVPDPTFLIDSKKWKELAVSPQEAKYILVFSLGKRKIIIDKAIEIANHWNCKVKVIDQTFKYKDSLPELVEIIDDAGPLEFIGLIKNATLVLTDSFHCTVFSIITGAKNFYSYLHKSDNRGSRVCDLLKVFNLSDRLIYSMDSIPDYNKLLEVEINHSSIQEIINKEQQIGQLYLNESLVNGNTKKNQKWHQ